MPKNPANFPDKDIPPAIKEFIHDSKTRSKINNYLNALTLPELGFYVYELLLIYVKALEAEIDIDMKKALETNDIKRLRLVGEEVEISKDLTGQTRSLIYVQEERMRGILKGINKTLKKYNEKPISAFCHLPKGGWGKSGFFSDKDNNAECPSCGKINKNFKYDSPCSKCKKIIWSPWKEYTVCPGCDYRISISDIIELKEEYDFDNHFITCPQCGSRFNWKEYKHNPEVRGIKICINCHSKYIPDKYNWRTQLLCEECKGKGIETHNLFDPDYQKNYRKKMKLKKK